MIKTDDSSPARTVRAARSPRWPSSLVGVTATGPIYRSTIEVAHIPLRSGLRLLQELALRIDHPRAAVTSSLASRVHGELAHTTWMRLSAGFAAGLADAPLTVRVAVLREVLDEVRETGRIDGLEPVLCSTINGTWTWLTRRTTDHVLDYALTLLKDSEVAQLHAVPVSDPNRRTVTVFGPSELNRLDASSWRADREIGGDQYLSGTEGLGPTVGDVLGAGPGDDLGYGTGGLSASDLIGGGLGRGPAGVPGGLPSINDLGGGRQHGRAGDRQSLDDIAAGLLGGGPGRGPAGVPGGPASINDLIGGGRRPGSGGRGLDNTANEWLNGAGSEWGHAGREMGGGRAGRLINGGWGSGTPGGPFNPTGHLGLGGSESPDDGVKTVVGGVAGVGYGMGVYGTGMIAGAGAAAGSAAAAGAAIAMTGGAIIIAAGAFAIGYGIGELVFGGSGSKPASGNTDTKPAPGEQKPQPVQEPKPKDEDPHKDDKYPSPAPGAGVAIWDDEHPGGHPNTIWDEGVSGGGVGPSRIWDDNTPGGGVGPSRTFTATMLSVPGVTGAGLRAGITQTGPATIAF